MATVVSPEFPAGDAPITNSPESVQNLGNEFIRQIAVEITEHVLRYLPHLLRGTLLQAEDIKLAAVTYVVRRIALKKQDVRTQVEELLNIFVGQMLNES